MIRISDLKTEDGAEDLVDEGVADEKGAHHRLLSRAIADLCVSCGNIAN
jgi:hypothetical protein